MLCETPREHGFTWASAGPSDMSHCSGEMEAPPHGEGTHPPLKEAAKWGLSQSDVKATLLGILGESAA